MAQVKFYEISMQFKFLEYSFLQAQLQLQIAWVDINAILFLLGR